MKPPWTSAKGLVAVGIAVAVACAVAHLCVTIWIKSLAISRAEQEFGRVTGLPGHETTRFRERAVRMAEKSTRLGIGAAEVLRSSAAMCAAFGSSLQAEERTLITISLLYANFGVEAGASAKVIRKFMGTAGCSEEIAADLARWGAVWSRKGGIPVQLVFGDLANASSETLGALGDDAARLVATAIESRWLGVTLDDVVRSGRAFLDFRRSVEAEMAASALFGRSINVQAIRRLIQERDFIGARKESLRQIQTLGSLNTMSGPRQRAIVALYGIELNEVNRMIAAEKLRDEMRRDPGKSQALKDFERGITTQRLSLRKSEQADVDDEFESKARIRSR